MTKFYNLTARNTSENQFKDINAESLEFACSDVNSNNQTSLQ